jgi:deazaflavin-dependent oxidoreductase (nitroreductase family)
MPIPKSIAKFNKYITNRFTLLFAGWIPPLAIIKHRGRISGRKYRTPVLAFPTNDGYVFALTYGRAVDWVKNLIASDSGRLMYNGMESSIHSIRFVSYEDVKDVFPVLINLFLRILSVNDCLIAEKQGFNKLNP